MATTSQNNDASSGCSYIDPSAGTSLIRDTICASTAADGQGLGVSPATGTTLTVNLRNVTVASVNDSGIFSFVQAGETLSVNATNVIASGPGTDIEAQGTGNNDGDAGPLELRQRLRLRRADDHAGRKRTNQTALPVFVNPASNFRQAADRRRSTRGPPSRTT